MKERAFPHYPVFLDVHAQKCLVVGGGHVAYRKVKVLLEHGASVRVVSTELCPEMKEMADSIDLDVVLREYRTEDLQSTFLAIAATDDARVNERVAEEARERKVLVNVVDDMDNSLFIAPSYLRRGDVAVAISTGGKSPALARRIRTKLEAELGPEYAELALLLSEIRTELKNRRYSVSGGVWQEALDLDLLLDLIRQQRTDEAKAMLLNRLGVVAPVERG
jgi:siroheme synthase-like protein